MGWAQHCPTPHELFVFAKLLHFAASVFLSVKWESPQSCHAHWVREGMLSIAQLAHYGHSARASAPSWLLEPESMKMLVMGGGGGGSHRLGQLIGIY